MELWCGECMGGGIERCVCVCVCGLTWMEYMMILKQRTANIFPSHRQWLSRCLEERGMRREGGGEERDEKDEEREG